MTRGTLTDSVLADLQHLDRAFSRMLGTETVRGGHLPAVDIYETEDDVVIELDAPGLDADTLSAEVVDAKLVVAGERQHAQATRYFLNERWSGRFVRSFSVPAGFTGDVRADYHDGVLTLSLRKPEESKPKRIAITTGAQKQIAG